MRYFILVVGNLLLPVCIVLFAVVVVTSETCLHYSLILPLLCRCSFVFGYCYFLFHWDCLLADSLNETKSNNRQSFPSAILCFCLLFSAVFEACCPPLFSRCLFYILFGLVSWWPCGVQQRVSFVIVSSFLFIVHQFQFIISCTNTISCSVFFHSSLLLIFPGHNIFRILQQSFFLSEWVSTLSAQ